MKLFHRRRLDGRTLFESVTHFYNGDPQARKLADAIRASGARARVVRDGSGFDHVFVPVASLAAVDEIVRAHT